MTTRAAGSKAPRLYCLVPAELECALSEPLRHWFRASRTVGVVVERRQTMRRAGSERSAAMRSGARGERRGEGDRRRRVRLKVEAPELPPIARAHRHRLVFVRAAGAEVISFDELYATYYEVLHRYFCRALRTASEADDLTQAVLTNAFDALSRGDRPVDAIEPWLFAIARNVLLKHIEKHKRITVVEIDDIDRHREASGFVDPPELGWVTQPRLLASVAALSERERQIVDLRFELDLSLAAAARVLDSTPTNVQVTQSLAIGKLRTRLTAGGERGSRAVFDASRLPAHLGRVHGRSISVLPRNSPRDAGWRTARAWR